MITTSIKATSFLQRATNGTGDTKLQVNYLFYSFLCLLYRTQLFYMLLVVCVLY